MKEIPTKEKELKQIKSLREFSDSDLDYFKELEGENGWIAYGDPTYQNVRYFVVDSDNDEHLGIVGLFDFEDQKNVTHAVVDPKFRGQGLAQKFLDKITKELDLKFYICTVDLDNVSSLRAMGKNPNLLRVSDADYEEKYHKVKFQYEKSEQKK